MNEIDMMVEEVVHMVNRGYSVEGATDEVVMKYQEYNPDTFDYIVKEAKFWAGEPKKA